MNKKMKKDVKLSPSAIIAVGFLLLILTATLLLMLPISARNRQSTPLLTSLFTATSAVCVTGQALVDTGTHWSLFGQVVLIVAIQIGGLGVMTLMALVSMALGKRIGLRQRTLLQCLIDRNCEHQEILDSGSSTILFLGITNAIFNDIMKHLSTSGRIASFLNMALLEQKNLQQYLHFRPQPEGMEKMEQALYQLLSELKQHDVASPLICQGLLLRIFRILGTNYEFSLSKQLRKQMNWILFEEITDYMENHLTQISITGLSEEFHFQEDYFNRLIKTQTGLTYTEYLQLLRLRRAETLLLTTDATIDQITEAVGYHNKGYFYKIFTERHQLTPAQFRKKM